MAEKKNEKERSVEERLKSLYQLQTLLSEIDRIKILRGELPNEVKDREDEIVRYQTRIQKFEDEIASLRELIATKTADIETRRQKIARYDEQINNVRNNREFAFLEKEKEFETLEIQLAEKNIRDANTKIEEKTAEITHNREELTDNEHILEQKRVELDGDRRLHARGLQAYPQERPQRAGHRDRATRRLRRLFQPHSAPAPA